MATISCLIENDLDDLHLNLTVPSSLAERVALLENNGYDEEHYISIDDAILMEYDDIGSLLNDAATDCIALKKANGSYPKRWNPDIKISQISTTPYDVGKAGFEGDPVDGFWNYLKVLQWKCSERIDEYFCDLTDNSKDKETIRELASEHNSAFPMEYYQWVAQDGSDNYAFTQSVRQINERLYRSSTETLRQLGADIQDDLLREDDRVGLPLTTPQLEELISMLNERLLEIDPEARMIKIDDELARRAASYSRMQSDIPEAGQSLPAISTPFGGQPGWSRRRRTR